MKFGVDIHVHPRIDCNNFGDPSALNLSNAYLLICPYWLIPAKLSPLLAQHCTAHYSDFYSKMYSLRDSWVLG